MAAQQFLAFHGEEIAIEHGRRFDDRLGERHRRQFDRKAAGLIDAALHVLGAVAQMAVAGVDVAPGVDDADHRLAGPVGAVIAESGAAASDGRTSADRSRRASDSCADSSGDLFLAVMARCACLAGNMREDSRQQNRRHHREHRDIDVPPPMLRADRRLERQIAVCVVKAAVRAAGRTRTRRRRHRPRRASAAARSRCSYALGPPDQIR